RRLAADFAGRQCLRRRLRKPAPRKDLAAGRARRAHRPKPPRCLCDYRSAAETTLPQSDCGKYCRCKQRGRFSRWRIRARGRTANVGLNANKVNRPTRETRLQLDWIVASQLTVTDGLKPAGAISFTAVR